MFIYSIVIVIVVNGCGCVFLFDARVAPLHWSQTHNVDGYVYFDKLIYSYTHRRRHKYRDELETLRKKKENHNINVLANLVRLQ